MLRLSRTRRPPRNGEWNDQKVVTFIVTLAAGRPVTLAARISGMSRKAAYALRARDPSFAAAWAAALAIARSRVTAKGDSKGHNPPFAPPKSDSTTLRARDARRRDLFFAGLANRRPESPGALLARAFSLP